MKRNIEKELSILGITNNIDKLKYITNQIDCMEIIKLNKEYKLHKIFLILVNKKDIILYMKFV